RARRRPGRGRGSEAASRRPDGPGRAHCGVPGRDAHRCDQAGGSGPQPAAAGRQPATAVAAVDGGPATDLRTARDRRRAHRRAEPGAGARGGAGRAARPGSHRRQRGATVTAALTVPVRAERAYEVVIGRGVRRRLTDLLPGGVRVFLLYPPALADAVDTVADTLAEAGHQVLRHCTPDGEQAKTALVATECWAELGRA